MPKMPRQTPQDPGTWTRAVILAAAGFVTGLFMAVLVRALTRRLQADEDENETTEWEKEKRPEAMPAASEAVGEDLGVDLSRHGNQVHRAGPEAMV
jgi:hypothetical protein